MLLQAVYIFNGIQKALLMEKFHFLITQCIDIHRIPTRKMNHAFHNTGGAVLIDAVMGSFLRKAYQLTSADRAVRWKVVNRLRIVSSLKQRSNDLRYDISGLAYHNIIMNTDVLFLNHILIVQLCRRYRCTRNPHRLQYGIRSNTSRSSNRYHDIQQLCDNLFGRKFICNRPARHLDRGAQTILCVQIIHLDDHTVNRVGQIISLLCNFFDKLPHLIDALTHLTKRIHPQMHFTHLLQCLFMGMNIVFLCIHKVIPEGIQLTLCRNRAVQLTDTSRRRISRIRKQFFPVLFPFLIQHLKAGIGHIHLSAHFHLTL